MEMFQNHPLAPYTSFKTGGPAEELYIVNQQTDVVDLIRRSSPLHVLGYGCNVLISDNGLPGATLILRSNTITQQDDLLIADAGVWWDDLVEFSIQQQLYGLEMMSAIPGSVGAAVVGNIAAYGQAVSDTLAWVEVYDPVANDVTELQPEELGLSYRMSAFQSENMQRLIIIRAAFKLSSSSQKPLAYESALAIAHKNGWDTKTLAGRRNTILEARNQAGSLWDYRDASGQNQTAGSFFRNPIVTTEQAEQIIKFDETGKSADLIKKMNSVHGGDSLRVSAAHVLLAAGFKRGQSWGQVRLHPQHVLKIENSGDATSQEIYDVAQEIIATVQARLGITLIPEVRFLGEFR